MVIKKNHNVSQIAHILDRSIDDTVYKKSLKILKFYEKLKLSIEKETKNLINLIIKETDKLLSKINQNSSTIFKVIIDITKSIPIYIDDIRFIEEHNADISSYYFNLNSIRSRVSKEFSNFSKSLESNSFDDDLIIYQDLSTKYLKIIDIENLKCTDYIMENYYFTLISIIKDSNNIYYLCGYLDNNSMGRKISHLFTLNKLNMDMCTLEQLITENHSNVGSNISGFCKHESNLYFFCNNSFIYDIKEKVCRFFNPKFNQLKANELPIVNQIIPHIPENSNPIYNRTYSAGNLYNMTNISFSGTLPVYNNPTSGNSIQDIDDLLQKNKKRKGNPTKLKSQDKNKISNNSSSLKEIDRHEKKNEFLNKCVNLFQTIERDDQTFSQRYEESYTLHSNFYPSTSSVIKNEIYITGQLIEYLLKFKPRENLFEKIYSLGSNSKFIFDEFVIVSSKYLYEINENKLLKNNSDRFKINGLALFSSFRRGSYIYFIDDKYRIFRIDKENKSIREVIVSS